MTNIIGIDFSMNCAVGCIKYDSKIEYLMPEKHSGKFSAKYYQNDTPSNSATTFSALLPVEHPSIIAIEGGSFSSVGRTFDISECLGRLLYRLESMYPGVTIIRPSPKTIKKFATGSGNATKADMITAWSKETGNPIQYKYHKKTKVQLGINEDSPWSDIADAYYMMRYAEAIVLGLVVPVVKVKKSRKKTVK